MPKLTLRRQYSAPASPKAQRDAGIARAMSGVVFPPLYDRLNWGEAATHDLSRLIMSAVREMQDGSYLMSGPQALAVTAEHFRRAQVSPGWFSNWNIVATTIEEELKIVYRPYASPYDWFLMQRREAAMLYASVVATRVSDRYYADFLRHYRNELHLALENRG